jgi:hypothetical protein
MSLLRKATNQTAFLKAGIFGFQGSGKTFTAKELAIGLAQKVGDKKPVAFFDTETGSDFLIPAFNAAGIELMVAKTRAFKDLLTFVDEAEQSCSVAIIDSATHVWKELVRAYVEENKLKRGLEMRDWGPIKDTWSEFTDKFINSRLHIILCGRAGYEYDFETDDRGKKELIKTGTKMKTEGEFGFEPSLLLEMERLPKVNEDGDLPSGKGRAIKRGVRSGWTHRCYVHKDRTDSLDGSAIDDPSFEDFKPVIDFLNIGGEHVGVDTTRTSQGLFESPERYAGRTKQVQITLELIEATFVEADISSQSKDGKKRTYELLDRHFGTKSWKAVEGMKLETMEAGLATLRTELFPPVPAPAAQVQEQVQVEQPAGAL